MSTTSTTTATTTTTTTPTTTTTTSLRELTRTRQQTEFFANNQEQPPSNFGAPNNNKSNNDPIKKRKQVPADTDSDSDDSTDLFLSGQRKVTTGRGNSSATTTSRAGANKRVTSTVPTSQSTSDNSSIPRPAISKDTSAQARIRTAQEVVDNLAKIVEMNSGQDHCTLLPSQRAISAANTELRQAKAAATSTAKVHRPINAIDKEKDARRREVDAYIEGKVCGETGRGSPPHLFYK